MSTLNPYIPPTGMVSDTFASSEEFGTFKLFSAKGRLGRIRYLAYSIGISLVFSVMMMLVAGLGGFLLGEAGGIVAIAAMVLGYGAMIYIGILLLIQRCHDMGKSGWFALLALIPLASLIFLFWPGVKEANEYGAPLPPNSAALNWGVGIMLGIFVLATVASIAMPVFMGM